MAGHSKWANIKHRKGKADAKKGKLFSRASKEIINAVKHGGPDPKANMRLKIAIGRAKEVNFPNDNIDKLIKKASSTDQEAYHEIQYELYGHGGIGIIVDIMTDNKNRISSEIRVATNKRGGHVATPGSVAFNFDRKGVLTVSKEHAREDELFLAVSGAGAEDFVAEEDTFVILTPPEALDQVREAIKNLGVVIDHAALEWVPKSEVVCSQHDIDSNNALVEWIEELDDVEAVFHNMQLS